MAFGLKGTGGEIGSRCPFLEPPASYSQTYDETMDSQHTCLFVSCTRVLMAISLRVLFANSILQSIVFSFFCSFYSLFRRFLVETVTELGFVDFFLL